MNSEISNDSAMAPISPIHLPEFKRPRKIRALYEGLCRIVQLHGRSVRDHSLYEAASVRVRGRLIRGWVEYGLFGDECHARFKEGDGPKGTAE